MFNSKRYLKHFQAQQFGIGIKSRSIGQEYVNCLTRIFFTCAAIICSNNDANFFLWLWAEVKYCRRKHQWFNYMFSTGLGYCIIITVFITGETLHCPMITEFNEVALRKLSLQDF